MHKKGRILSFRPSQEDRDLIDQIKRERENGIRTLTDADILRYALKLVGDTIGKKKVSAPVKHEFNGSEQSFETISIGVNNNSENSVLTQEEREKGYFYKNGELLDKDGFPVEQMTGDVVIRNGEVYATEPKRAELKAQAKENSEKIMIDSPVGRVNPALAVLLEETSYQKHSNPGILTSQDGVDEEGSDIISEENFIND